MWDKTSVEVFVAKDTFHSNEWHKILEKPVSLEQKQEILSGLVNDMSEELASKIAKDMSKSQEKEMSTDYDLKVDVREQRDQKQEIKPARSRGFGMGM